MLNTTTDWNDHKDIERLTKLTKRSVSDLGEQSKLRLGDCEIRISRPCIQALQQHIKDQSIIVVGEAGVGKSRALYEVVTALLQEGKDTVFLTTSRIDAKTPSQLSEQLGLQHELDEILEHWKGHSPAFLVIDALDAIHSEPTIQMLLSLLARIMQTKSRWQVIVSIRKFELRYHRQLHHIFLGQPPIERYSDPDFPDICHVQIPALSEDEQSEIAQQSEMLQELFDFEDGKLKTWLQVPFNLHLISELLDAGVPVSELTSISTQLELLDRYWEERIMQPQDGLSHLRENVLARAVFFMVKNRSRKVSLADVVLPETVTAFEQLLDQHVLITWKASSSSHSDDRDLTFAQHGLFDYAVQRLMLRVELEFDQILAEQPELISTIRPSIEMHFQYLWSMTFGDFRSFFWEMVIHIIDNQQIPESGKVIGPIFAAKSCATLLDLQSLLQYLNTWRMNNVEKVLRYVIDALIAMGPSEKATYFVGPQAGPWAELMEYLSRNLSPNLASIIRPLLIELSTRANEMIEAQLTFSGIAARKLLKFVWSQDTNDEQLIADAITCVCRLFHSNPDASSLLLGQLLHKENIAKYGYLTIPCLVREMKHMLLHDPYFFVQDLYTTAFQYCQENKHAEHHENQNKNILLMLDDFQDYCSTLDLDQTKPEFASTTYPYKKSIRSILDNQD